MAAQDYYNQAGAQPQWPQQQWPQQNQVVAAPQWTQQAQAPSIPTCYHVYWNPCLGTYEALIFQSIQRSLCNNKIQVSEDDRHLYAIVPSKEADTILGKMKLKGSGYDRYLIRGLLIPKDQMPKKKEWTSNSQILTQISRTGILGSGELTYRAGFEVKVAGIQKGASTFHYGDIPMKFKRTTNIIQPEIEEENDKNRSHSRMGHRNHHYKLVSMMKVDQQGQKADSKGILIATFTDCFKAGMGVTVTKKKVGRINFDEAGLRRVFGDRWRENAVVESLLAVLGQMLTVLNETQPR